MKKLIIITLVLIFGSVSAYADETKKVFNFRGIEFGMTPDEVKAIETGELNTEASYDSILYYKVENLYELETYCKYYFTSLDSKGLEEFRFTLLIPQTDDFKSKYNEILVDLLAKYKADDDKPVYNEFWPSNMTFAPHYYIINERTFEPNIMVTVINFRGPDKHGNHIINIYFSTSKNFEDFFKVNKKEVIPVPKWALKKIIANSQNKND